MAKDPSKLFNKINTAVQAAYPNSPTILCDMAVSKKLQMTYPSLERAAPFRSVATLYKNGALETTPLLYKKGAFETRYPGLNSCHSIASGLQQLKCLHASHQACQLSFYRAQREHWRWRQPDSGH